MPEKMRIFSSVEDVYKALDEGVSIDHKFSYTHPVKTGGISKRLSLGRIWWNLLLPPNFPLVDEPVKSKDIGKTIQWIVNNYSPEEASDYVTKMNQETFRMSSYIPTSFEIGALIPSEEVNSEKEELKKSEITDPIEFSNEVEKITKQVEKDIVDQGYRMENIKVSGAKPVPWSQLLVAQGHVSDIEGNLLGPIKTAIADGHSPADFYKSAAEARRGFYYKSAISSKPGYMSRRTVMAGSHIQIDDSKEDCGTTKYFKLLVDENIAKLIKDRYMVTSTGKPKLIKDPSALIGKTINLRSPLYCKCEGGNICPTCFGESWKELNTKNLGILVGGAINDRALNAYMKMRHKSSVPKFLNVNFIESLSKYNILDSEFKKNFIVEETKITANSECFVNINLDDYHEGLVIESMDYYLIPGIFTVTLTEDLTKSWTLPFDFPVKLYKPANLEIHGKLMTFNFVPGELMVEQKSYQKTMDVTVLEQILEGQAKYINSPELMVFALKEYLDGIDLNLFEVLVQNMFRDAKDPVLPARMTDYTNYTILGQKRLPFNTSWINKYMR
jgi:hypothetical protein